MFQQALPGMLARGRGSLVQLVSSSSQMTPTRAVGRDGGGWALAYVASKAAVSKILPLLRLENADRESGVRYFNVEPGLVVTRDMLENNTAELFRKWGDVPAEVTGEVVAYLCTRPEQDAVVRRCNGAPFVYAPTL
jgi:NADP-dependent 3-hydroxy acid dehydrogenase YdfG